MEFLAGLPGAVRAVDEAGPTGFGFARAATDRGIDVRVVAAGKVPRASGDRIKTDRRDAERLVRLLAAGELRFAFVPTVADEQFRDVIRAIEDCRGDLMRARHRLSKLLLRRDLRWTGPGSPWTRNHMRWLHSLRFDDVCSQATFLDDLSGVEMLVARRAALLAALDQVIPDSRHAPTIASAALLPRDRHAVRRRAVRRGRQLQRASPNQLVSGFLGIVPSEHTSDLKRRQGAITKAGLRSMPTSCWSKPRTTTADHPPIGATLARRQHSQDPRVIEIAWRAQGRLTSAGSTCAPSATKHASVVAIACAHELAAFRWEAAILN